MLEMTGSPRELSDRELHLLRVHEDEIGRAEQAHYRAVGKNYAVIRERKLYRAFGTWDVYCRERWSRTKQSVDRVIRVAVMADELEAAGLPVPMTERQGRPLGRLSSSERFEVVRRVVEAGGWRRLSPKEVESIAEEVSPRSSDRVTQRPAALVIITSGGRVGPSTRAKGRILRGLESMAKEADAIQALGPYAIEDMLRAMSESESNAARDSVYSVLRLLARFSKAWEFERGEQPEEGQQSLPIAA